MTNKERVEKLVLDFVDHVGFDKPMENGYKLWEEINKDTPTIEELLELGYVGLFITTLDACISLCLLGEDMYAVENVHRATVKEHLEYRSEMLDLRLRELLVKIIKDRLDK